MLALIENGCPFSWAVNLVLECGGMRKEEKMDELEEIRRFALLLKRTYSHTVVCWILYGKLCTLCHAYFYVFNQ